MRQLVENAEVGKWLLSLDQRDDGVYFLDIDSDLFYLSWRLGKREKNFLEFVKWLNSQDLYYKFGDISFVRDTTESNRIFINFEFTETFAQLTIQDQYLIDFISAVGEIWTGIQ